jgi:hypothetical protein
VVVPERKLVDVFLKVLPAHRMVRADDAALKLAPKTLNSVGVDVAANILLFAVIHLSVTVAKFRRVAVYGKLVTVERSRAIHVAGNVGKGVRSGDGGNHAAPTAVCDPRNSRAALYSPGVIVRA